MNDDLISREEAYKAFSDYLNRNIIGEISSRTELSIGEIASVIKSIPTAFDKEKVMEKLKHCRDYYDVNEQPKKPFDYWECADIRERKGKWMAYDDAIEIVEKGRIE